MIEIENITYTYPTSTRTKLLFENFSLKIDNNQIVSIIGPSGCGKTTLLNIIAGYIKADHGCVKINGEPVTKAGRDRIMINQENDIFDWMTVEENISLALDKNQIKDEVNKNIILTRLSGFEHYFPGQLSGGMKKRVSIARALTVKSRIILLDEAFDSLDHVLREELFLELSEIIKLSGTTAIIVTHDIEDALFISDRIILLDFEPLQIYKDIYTSFPRPRNWNLKETIEFRNIKKEISHHQHIKKEI